MKMTVRWKHVAMSALLAASLMVLPHVAFADPAADQQGQGLETLSQADGQDQNAIGAAGQGLGAGDGQTPWGEDDVLEGYQPDNDGSAAPADDNPEKRYAVEGPRNGIPTMTIFVDESDQAIADARANDPEHRYGTLHDLLSSDNHSVRSVGNIGITVPEGYVSEYGSADVPSGILKLEFLRGRGNTTWGNEYNGFPAKRAFKFKLDEKSDFFGMGASKEWTLLANTFDATLLKNRLTVWLASEMGMPYTPQMVPVDVVMVRIKDGQEIERTCLGSYCLSEQIDVESGRVDIDKLKKDDGDDADVTGGYLISMYDSGWNHDEPANNVFSFFSGMQFYSRSPQFEDGGQSEARVRQHAYLKDYLQNVDKLVMGGDSTYGTFIDESRHNEIDEVLDLQSAANYWWIQAFTRNADAYRTDSSYLYMPRGGKLCWGPVWDFDLGWCYALGEQNAYTQFGGSCAWFRALTGKDPQFVRLLKERWSDPETGLEAKLIELTRDGGKLDAYRDEIRASWQENEEIDGDADAAYREVGRAEFDEYIEALRDWVDMRREWISANLDDVGAQFVNVSYVVDGEERGREVMDREEPCLHWPDVLSIPGHEFEGWCLQGTNEVIAGADAPSDIIEVKRDANWDFASWGLKGSDEIVVCPKADDEIVFVAKFKGDTGSGPGVPEDWSPFPNEVVFLNSSDLEPVCDGHVAYRASVLLPNESGYDWTDSRMTFVVHPVGTKDGAKTVEVPFSKAVMSKGDNGRDIATFELPLSSIEMGQVVECTFTYSRDGKAESATYNGTLGDQLSSYAKWGADRGHAAYAKALHDFGRTAYGFFAAHGNVKADKYSPVNEILMGSFDWDAAKAGLKESLEGIGAGRDLGTSQVKKVCMSLRFDSETTVEFNIYTKRPVEGFSAHAACKGKTFKATKVSGTQWRIRVTGLRAADLGELIEVAGDCDGMFSMRCSALSYASAVLESGAYGEVGNDFMAAVYNYHNAAKALAE